MASPASVVCDCQAEKDRLHSALASLKRRVAALEGRTLVDPSLLVLGDVLSQGHFGEVYSAAYLGAKVAVKRVKPNCTIEDANAIQEFEAEIDMLRCLPAHPNILPFIGAVTDPGNLCIVTRFCERGSLHSYLRTEVLDSRRRKSVMLGIACGMAYLHAKRIIHRDLAARNILLDENLWPFISDYGLSRHLREGTAQGQWTQGKSSIPLRFLAPESAKSRIFSPKSDVWAFGLVLIEIFTRAQPYPTLKSTEVAVGLIQNTLSPEIPPHVLDNEPVVAKVMAGCWRTDPLQRPDFVDIQLMLANVQLLDEEEAGQMPFSHTSALKDDSWQIDNSEVVLGEQIAEGSSGIVWKCKVGATEYAIKQVKFASAYAIQAIRHEFAVLQRLRHPNIVRLVGVTTGMIPSLVTELAELGSLRDRLFSDEELSEDECLRILFDVGCGVEYLHRQRVIHRDLAARNILLDKYLRATICDFGLALYSNDTKKPDEQRWRAGNNDNSLPWKHMPPECQVSLPSHRRIFSPASDSWSFGCLGIELYSRSDLFPDLTAEAVGTLIASGDLTPAVPRGVVSRVAECLKGCLTVDPTLRLSMAAVTEQLSTSQSGVETEPVKVTGEKGCARVSTAEVCETTYFVEVRLPRSEFIKDKLKVDLDSSQTVRQAVQFILRVAAARSKKKFARSQDEPSQLVRSRSSSTTIFEDLRSAPSAEDYSFVVNNADVPDSTRLADIAFLLKGLPFVEIRNTRVPKEITEACAQILSRGLEASELFLWPVLAQRHVLQKAADGDKLTPVTSRLDADKDATWGKRFSRGVSFRSLKGPRRSRAPSDSGLNELTRPASEDAALRLAKLKNDIQEIESCDGTWGQADIAAVAETIVLYLFNGSEPLCSEDLLDKSQCAQLARKVLEGQIVSDEITGTHLAALVNSMSVSSQAILFVVVRMLFVYSRNASSNKMHPRKLAAVFAPLIFGGAHLPGLANPPRGKRRSIANAFAETSIAWLPELSEGTSVKTVICEALIETFESAFSVMIIEEEKHAQLPLWRGTVVAHSSSVNGMIVLEAEQDTMVTWSSSAVRIWALRNGSVTPGKLATLLKDQPRDNPVLDVIVGAQPNASMADIWISSVHHIQVIRIEFGLSPPHRDWRGAVAGPQLKDLSTIKQWPTGCASLVRSGGLVLGSPTVGTPGVSVWSVATFEFLGHVASPRVLTAMATIGDQLWGGTEDGGICVWTVMGRILTPDVQLSGKGRNWSGTSNACFSPHSGKIRSIIGVPGSSDGFDVDTVWTSGNDGLICIWKSTTFEPLRSFIASSSRVSLTWHSGFVWVSTWERTVRVLTTVGSAVVELKGQHSDGVTALAFCFDDQRRRWRFFTASYDRTVCVWVMPTHIVPSQNPVRLPVDKIFVRSSSFQALDLAAAEERSSGLEEESGEILNHLVHEAPYFHGDLSKSVAHRLLRGQDAGSFLFRSRSEPFTVAACVVMNDGHVKHIKYRFDAKHVHDGKDRFHNLQELVEARKQLFAREIARRESLSSSFESNTSSDDMELAISSKLRTLQKQGAVLSCASPDRHGYLTIRLGSHGTLSFIFGAKRGASDEVTELSIAQLRHQAKHSTDIILGDKQLLTIDAAKILELVELKWGSLK